MCGIAGLFSRYPSSYSNLLIKMRDNMVHRGPDDDGEWWSNDRRVGLAHRRLSIIDLSPFGHQPMSDYNGLLNIVFNGEIYNFAELRQELAAQGERFRSHSDTEVILAAYHVWGMNCLSHLNGTFSFALYDSQRQMGFFARDRAGEKPFFYHLSNGTLLFASELKGLLVDESLPRIIDSEAFDCYLSFGFVPGDSCILKEFKKLPPAHAMQFDLNTGGIKVWRYWQLPELEMANGKVNEEALLDELESLLEKSVRRQLVADVPVGVLLSGGVDSSLVTAMAVRSSSCVKTFTIRFPGHGKLDETEHARLIARHFGTEHIELEAQAVTADLLPRLAHQYDEPIVDSSMIPTFLLSQLVRQHCTVALGGDGGDELFGGYTHYSRLLWMQNRLDWIPLSLRRAVSLFAKNLLPIDIKGRSYMLGLLDLDNGVPLIASYFDANTRGKLIGVRDGWSPLAEDLLNLRVPKNMDLIQRATRMDFQDFLAEDILVKVDRASMLNSLEVRAPLLDYHLIEFAFRKVPSHLKVTTKEKKILLKRLTSRVLPSKFDQHRKQGFSIPLSAWLKRGDFREFFWNVLTDSHCIFDRKSVEVLLRRQDKGYNNGERIFALVLFELWRREYGVTF